MKIAFVVTHFPVLSQTFIINQIIALIQAGHSITIFSYNRGNLEKSHPGIKEYDLLNKTDYKSPMPSSSIEWMKALIKFAVSNPLKLHWDEIFRCLYISQFNFKKSLRLIQSHKWFLSGKRFDIIHAHFGSCGIAIGTLKQIGLLSTSKFIVTFHGHDLTPNSSIDFKEDYKSIFESADVLTVNTPYSRDLLLQINPGLKKIEILPVGLNTEFFIRNHKRNEKFKILFCGRLIPLKGPDIVVDIFYELISRGYKKMEMDIIGEGELKEVVRGKINRYKLEKEIHLLGALEPEVVKKKCQESAVFILPGVLDPETQIAETQGLVIQEAQSMELPVIVSDVGGMKYGLLDGESGFVIKAGDIVGFADVIEKFILDEKLISGMGKKGREHVVKNYDSKVLNDQLLRIYGSVL